MNRDTQHPLLPSAPTGPSADSSPVPSPAARFVVLPRRLFGLRLLGAVPLAIAAAVATPPQSVQAGTDGDWTLTGNALPDSTKFLGTTNAQALTIKTDNATRLTVTSAGRVGIGTTAPATKFHVVTSITAVRGETTGTSGTIYGVHGVHTGTSSTGVGVYGKSTNGQGVWGYHEGTSGVEPGVRGTTSSTSDNAVGVYGATLSASSGIGSVGVYGLNSSTVGTGYGMYGRHKGNGVGVEGKADGPGGTGVVGSGFNGLRAYSTSETGYGLQAYGGAYGVYTSGQRGVYAQGSIYGMHGYAYEVSSYGVIGEANASGSYGVWGKSFDGEAGHFDGNVTINGFLFGGGGSASRIDHPLDPANQYLSHSFVESPDMLNVYNGNVTTDTHGVATVELPAYIEALNRDFRYQLTVIGEFAQAIVAREITDHRFTIKTDKPNVKVSWQVTGVRQDGYANAHRIPVEQAKPDHERGKYLYPVEAGQPEALGVDYERRHAISQRQAPRYPAPQQPSDATPQPPGASGEELPAAQP